MPPRIGIALEMDRRRQPGRAFVTLDAAYAEAVAGAGGVPLYVSPPGPIEPVLAQLDALLVPGGGDFLPPVPYEGVAFRAVEPEQLAFDRALVAGALARGLPVLGVCYGMQLLAESAGGTLVYDIARDVPRAGSHQLGSGGRHEIAVEPGSRLAAILGGTRAAVNSRHHQAVAEPGAGLRVCARSDDGVVEAIEASGARFALGVQWHPESMDDAHRRRVFGAFVGAAREAAARS